MIRRAIVYVSEIRAIDVVMVELRFPSPSFGLQKALPFFLLTTEDKQPLRLWCTNSARALVYVVGSSSWIRRLPKAECTVVNL